MKNVHHFFKHNDVNLIKIIIVLVGFALSFWIGKALFRIIDNNAFAIITEMLFPIGNYYGKIDEVYQENMDDDSDGSLNTEDEHISGSTEEMTTEFVVEIPEQTEEFTDSEEDDKIAAVAGSLHSIEELTDYNFVMKHFYVVANATTLTKEILKLEEIVNMDLTIEKKSEKPQILIFHTHSQEGFSDTESNGKSIVDVGRYLTKILTEEYGYNVLHITEEFDMRNGKLDRGLAYTYANERIEEILKQYPEIEVVIDVHRDGIDESRHLVTEVDGRQTAQIMLFNGISYTDEQGELENIVNPYRTENLAMTYHMYLLGEKMYPDFIRCIYIQGYRYCLHHRARSLLIEAGAQTNSYEEVCNAMIPLARILATELGEK